MYVVSREVVGGGRWVLNDVARELHRVAYIPRFYWSV